jgi:hypothetical protein
MAEAEITKAVIVNWALAEIGRAPNFSIDDDTKLGGLVDIFWPRAVARCFGLTDWTFCRRTTRLTRQEAEPQTGYAYGYDLPGDRIGEPLKLLYDARDQRPLRDFRIEGDTLFCDDEAAWAVCRVEVDPAYWPVQFRDAFAVALSALLAVPLMQDLELAAEKEVKAFGTRSEGGAGGMFGRILAQNRTAGPVSAPLLGNDPLTGAHGNLAGPWWGRG